jgi:DNA-binding transcriptional ArsR family regulator
MFRYFDKYRNMDTTTAVAALAALAQETRLGIFRRLVAAGSAGLSAGTLARALRIAPSNLTFHAQSLESADLVRSRRQGRQVFYSLNADAMRNLLGFLVDDCCGGSPELCLPPAKTLVCCPPPTRSGATRPAIAERSRR